MKIPGFCTSYHWITMNQKQNTFITQSRSNNQKVHHAYRYICEKTRLLHSTQNPKKIPFFWPFSDHQTETLPFPILIHWETYSLCQYNEFLTIIHRDIHTLSYYMGNLNTILKHGEIGLQTFFLKLTILPSETLPFPFLMHWEIYSLC